MEKFLTERELAARWKVSTGTLQNKRAAQEHDGLYTKIGGSVRYFLKEIEEYERRNRP